MPLDIAMTALSIILMGGSYHTESQMVRGFIPREIFRTQNYADCGEHGNLALRTFSDDERSYDGVVYSAESRG